MEKNIISSKKSVYIAYLLWLIGGFFGLHHIYLRRDRHAFVWWCTIGGYFGIGWMLEIFRIPEYVRDANEDQKFIESYIEKLRKHRVPPFSTKRFIGALMVSYIFGNVIYIAIPENIVIGIDWSFLHWLIPLGVALGVWTVGNIGREKGSLNYCLLAAYLIYPIRYIVYDETYWLVGTTFASALAFDSLSKDWRREPPVRHGLCKRTFTLSVAITLYLTVWGCYFYFNGKIIDSDGDEVPIQEALKNFLASKWWTDMKQTLYDTYNYAQSHGWYETWSEIFESMDVDGERTAYKVLDVSATASQTEITAAWRKLSKQYHPDKQRDPVKREESQNRFMEVQQAYEILSKIKSKRRSRNKKFNDDL